METYTLRGLQATLGIPRSIIQGLMASGFVTPTRGARREYRFSFQDVVLLRTAHGLQKARIPPRKILQSLRRLKATLPSEMPLTGLRITAIGSEVAVKEGARQWQADTGQLLLDFEVGPAAGANAVGRLPSRPGPGATVPPDGRAWFERGVALEADDPEGAEAAYREAVRAAPDDPDPVLNLGVMLCDSGRAREAEALYRAAITRAPDHATLHYNLALALEDLGRLDEALACYARCLALAPRFADAHYNAARLHELNGDSSRAIRHFNEYRRLSR